MKFNLLTFSCAFAVFYLKLKFNYGYHLPPSHLQYLQQLNTNYHQLQPQHEDYSVHLKTNYPPEEVKELGGGQDFNFAHEAFFSHETHYGNHLSQQYDYQQQAQPEYFHELHLQQLAESVKDPKNLRNAIYHDGAVTYDLGLPNYKILNPYDPPEIITPNHPHYHQHLHHIKQTNNFTIENFGVTPMAQKEMIRQTSLQESPTTDSLKALENELHKTTTTTTVLETPETTTMATTTRTTPFKTTTETLKITAPLLPEFQPSARDLQKYLNKNEAKLKILKNDPHLKSKNHTDLEIVFIKTKEAVENTGNEIPLQQPYNNKYLLPQDEPPVAVENPLESDMFPVQQLPFATDSKETINEPPLIPFYNGGSISAKPPLVMPSFYPPFIDERSDESENEFFEQGRIYRSLSLEGSAEESSTESSTENPTESFPPSTSTESLDFTTTLLPSTLSEDDDEEKFES